MQFYLKSFQRTVHNATWWLIYTLDLKKNLLITAQEQSVLMKEIAFHVGMALDSQQDTPISANISTSMPAAKKNSAIITDHNVIRANNLETSMS